MAGLDHLWSEFYKKTLHERRDTIKLAFPDLDSSSYSQPLMDSAADNMVENCIGFMGFPVGLALHFKVNGKSAVVPMAIEEPSVVAAASGAAKFIGSLLSEGFTATHSARNIMIAQIQLDAVSSSARADLIISDLHSHRAEILQAANQYCASMVQRGGGVVDVRFRVLKKRSSLVSANFHGFFIVIHLHVDVCESMGANCVITVAEGVTPLIESLSGLSVGLRILSNLCTERMVSSQFRIPVDLMTYKGLSGDQVARRIVDAYHFALSDPYRAATHNKGIFNGIDAVAIATGQDWRAAEASGHAYCVEKHGFYGPLTEYLIETDSAGREYFLGRLEMPLSVGIFGGSMRTNPAYSWSLQLLGYPTSQELAMIVVSVGLAQNFAALRALATEGIQRGHMALHARNIAIAAGAPSHAVTETAAFMITCGNIHFETALKYLKTHNLLSKKASFVESPDSPPLSIHDSLNSDEAVQNGNSQTPARDSLPSAQGSTVDPSCKSHSLNPSNGDSGQARKAKLKAHRSIPFSIFFYKEPNADKENLQVKFNVAFQTLGSSPVSIEFGAPESCPPHLYQQLFGSKGHVWISSVYESISAIRFLDQREYETALPLRKNSMQVKQLKMLSLLMNVITNNLSVNHALETKKFLEIALVMARKKSHSLLEPPPEEASKAEFRLSFPKESSFVKYQIDSEDTYQSVFAIDRVFSPEILKTIDVLENPDAVLVGLPLLLNMWQVFEYEARSWVGDGILADLILDEQCKILTALINQTKVCQSTHCSNTFMTTHAKRFQMTMMFLCDAVSFPGDSFDPDTYAFIMELGSALEYKAAYYHDLANAPEDAAQEYRVRQVLHGMGVLDIFSKFDALCDDVNTEPSMKGRLDEYINIISRNSYMFWLRKVSQKEHSAESLQMFQEATESILDSFECRLSRFTNSLQVERLFGKHFIAKISRKFEEFKFWKTVFHI